MRMPAEHEVNIFMQIKRIILRPVRQKDVKAVRFAKYAYGIGHIRIIKRNVVHSGKIDLITSYRQPLQVSAPQHANAVLCHDVFDLSFKIAFVVACYKVNGRNLMQLTRKLLYITRIDQNQVCLEVT